MFHRKVRPAQEGERHTLCLVEIRARQCVRNVHRAVRGHVLPPILLYCFLCGTHQLEAPVSVFTKYTVPFAATSSRQFSGRGASSAYKISRRYILMTDGPIRHRKR
eukprot:493962-Pyramimonas_sp.AAC.1